MDEKKRKNGMMPVSLPSLSKVVPLPLPVLTKSQVEQVMSTFKSKLHSTTILSRINNVQVTIADARHLDKNAWLNDELVNLTCEIFMDSMASMTSRRNFFLWSSYFVSRLIDNETDSYKFEFVEHWVERNNRLSEGKISAYREFIFPINYKNSHWLMLYANLDDKKICILDSLSDYVDMEHRQNYASGIFNWLTNYFKRDTLLAPRASTCLPVIGPRTTG